MTDKNRIENCFDGEDVPPHLASDDHWKIAFGQEEDEEVGEAAGIEPPEEYAEEMFHPAPLSEQELREIFIEEDKQEINMIIGEIRYYSARLDKHAFNPAMKKVLRGLITILKIHKKQLVQQYYERYGRPEII